MKRPWLIFTVGAGLVLVSVTAAYTGRVIDPRGGSALDDTRTSPRAAEQLDTGSGLPALPAIECIAVRYNARWQAINAGGEPATGGTYQVNLSIGQSSIGAMANGSYKAGVGYWYGAFAVPIICACDCHTDPQCDGKYDVLDIVKAVNVAFRGGVEIPDPNPDCPCMTTDVDCSLFTNAIDVVRMVNVAFRAADPASQFCDPCTP
jgi:hypothetical protein